MGEMSAKARGSALPFALTGEEVGVDLFILSGLTCHESQRRGRKANKQGCCRRIPNVPVMKP